MRNNTQSERARLGYTQQDLAEALDVSRDVVRNWEDGTTAIRSTKLVAMADLFGCSLDYLMGRSEERVLRYAVPR